MPEDMPEHMPEDMPGRMPEDMPDRMPGDMPDKMPEDMSDRMPEDLPVTKPIDVMVGITRSKVIFVRSEIWCWIDWIHGDCWPPQAEISQAKRCFTSTNSLGYLT